MTFKVNFGKLCNELMKIMKAFVCNIASVLFCLLMILKNLFKNKILPFKNF